MLLNYIKIAFRNLIHHKLYSIINIMGLAIGMACAIPLLLFVRYELTYDWHQSKHDRIYIVKSNFKTPDNETTYYLSPYPMAPALKDEYPAIEESVRIYRMEEKKVYFIDQKGVAIGEEDTCYADPGIFRIFDYDFIAGSPEGALDDRNTIVLSETFAKKYFGNQNPVGKILANNKGVEYIVKGVYREQPGNSFNRYAAIMCFKNLAQEYGSLFTESRSLRDFFTGTGQCHAYILLAENNNIKSITDDYERFKKKYYVDSQFEVKPVFELLTDVYLNYNEGDSGIFSLKRFRLYTLLTLAIAILIIACINYINIDTSRSFARAKEVGVRKTLGADRRSLVVQFLIESFILSLISLFLALGIIEIFLPTFNSFTGKALSLSLLNEPRISIGLLILACMVGLFSGSYPAFFTASFHPYVAIKGADWTGRGKLRKFLICFQFSLSIIVIISTILLHDQLAYIQQMDPGFDKKNVIIFAPREPGDIDLLDTLKNEILNHSGILNVSNVSSSPIGVISRVYYGIENSEGVMAAKIFDDKLVDYNFIEMMGITILEGRSFDKKMETDRKEAFLVNEALVREMGWTGSPINKRIISSGENAVAGKVIGVFKDVHFRDLRTSVEPMIIRLGDKEDTSEDKVMLVKIDHEDLRKTIEYIKSKWNSLNPVNPFEYRFLDEIIYEQFDLEEKFNTSSIFFAGTSIFLSILGLFGLSSFILEKRTKETGIRKVLGATALDIIYHLFRDFFKLVIISSLIAWPVTYLIIDRIIVNYPYRASINLWIFPLTSLFIILITLLTVSYHAIKAAMTDPVKALRYE